VPVVADGTGGLGWPVRERGRHDRVDTGSVVS
jgi:hypothetical protein